MPASDADDIDDIPPDHPRRLLMIAYTRLSKLLPGCNGMRSTTIAAFGDHVVRLIELSSATAGQLFPPIWIELYDAGAHQTLDGVGCNDLSEAVAAAQDLLARAKRLNARPTPSP